MSRTTSSRKSDHQVRRRLRKRAQLNLETLERRELLATVTWDGGAGTANWGDANNWDNNQVPGTGDTARFASLVSGPITVDLGGATRNVAGVVFDNNVQPLIASETFETDGDGSRYTIGGRGNNGGTAFWSRNLDAGVASPPAFTGMQGTGFFAGADTDNGFNPNANSGAPKTFTMNIGNLTGLANPTLTIALAGSPANTENTDFFRIKIDPDGAGPAGLTQITEFLGGATGGGYSNGSTLLTNNFQDLTFALPADMTTAQLVIEQLNSADNEAIGFDNIRVTAGPAATYTLTNGTIGAGGSTLAITQNGTNSNTIGALIAAAAPTTTVTVNAGKLALGNALNTFDNTDSVTVNSGGTLNFAIGTAGVRGIGTAVVNLNGGTLGLIGGIGGLAAGLLEGYIDGNFNLTTPNPGTPRTAGDGTGGSKLQAVAGNFQADTAPYWNGDNITWVYTGQFFDADGVVSFAANIDDSTLVRIDGIDRINNTQWDAPDSTGILNLGMGAAGDGWHDIEIRFAEGGGGAGPSAQNNNGWINWTNTHGFGMNSAGSTSTDANQYPAPVDPGNGTLFRGQPVATAGTNTINVAGASTINTGVFGTVSFGTLNMASNASLNVVTPGTVTFSGATTLAGANTISNTGTLVLTGAVSGAGASLTKAGSGTLVLSSANSYTGATTVNGGVLRVDADGALGTTAAGTTVNAGATLALRSTYTALEQLTLIGGTLESTGNNTYAADITGQGNITATSGTLTLPGTIRNIGLTVSGAGTTNITGQVTNNMGAFAVNGFQETIFNGVPADAQSSIEGYRAAALGASDARGILTGPLTYPNDGAVSARATQLGAVGFDNGDYSQMWLATFTPNETGNWGLRYANVDDNASMWIDYNQNGTFETATERVQFRGCCGNSGDQTTQPLTAGQKYLIGFVMSDTGGGGAFTNLEFKSPTAAGVTGGAFMTVNPSAFPGTFSLPTLPLVKNGSGTLILANATNDYAAATQVNAGTLRATTASALGSSALGTSVANGATLQLSGNFSTAEPITMMGAGAGGAGALTGSGATSTGPIAILGDTTIANPTAGTTLTITGAISKPALASVITVTGAGDVNIQSAIGNGAARFGPMVARVFNNLTGGAGVGDPANVTNLALSAAPGGLTAQKTLTGALNFPADADGAFNGFFGTTLGNFTATFAGDLVVTQAGSFTFGISQQDDNATVWIDSNQDNTLQAGELIQQVGCCGNTAVPGARTLNPGTYKIVYIVEDTGGGSGLVGRVSVNPTIPPTNSTTMPLVVAGGTDDLIKNGTGTLTLGGNNTYNGTTTINAGTVIAASANALGATTPGTTVSKGATLALQGGVNVSEPLTINGIGATGRNGVLDNISGNNTLSGLITAADANRGEIRLGSSAGTLTIGGNINPRFSSISVAGAGNVVIAGNVLPAAAAFLSPGGLHGNYYGGTASVDTMLNPSAADPNKINLEFQTPTISNFLTPRVDFGVGTDTVPGDGNTLDRDGLDGNEFGGLGINVGNDNQQALWTGQINIPQTADYTFTTRSDDGSRLWIDINNDGDFTDAGEQIVDNNFFQGMTNRSGTINGLTAGPHMIRIAGYEGGGGAGFQASWQQLTGNSFARRIIEPGVLGDFLFPDSRLTKTGTGTLTINGTAGFSSGVTITGGTINGTGTLNAALTINGALSGGGTGAVGTLTVGTPIPVTAAVATQSSAGTFPVLNNDLLNGRTPTVSGNTLGGDEGTSSNPAVLTNGQFGAAGLPDAAALAQTVSIKDNTVLTYALDTAANPQGFDLTSIDVYSAWRDGGRDNINVTVSVATVDNPGTFVNVGTINFAPNPVGSGHGTLTSPLLGTRIGQVKFTFGPQENGYVGYRELDVVGVPSPSVLAIGATGSFLAEIGTTTADSVNVNGAVNIDPAATLALQFIGATTPNVGTSLTLIANDGTDPIVGTFAGIADDQIVTINGHAVRVDYNGGTGNDLVITLVPTPPAVTFNPAANPSGPENTPNLPASQTRIPLGINVSNLDNGATTTVTISGIPQSTGANAFNGARLVNSAGVAYPQSPAGTVTLTNVANGPLDVFLVKDDNRPQGTFNLTVSAVSVTGSGNSAPATTTRTVTVTNTAPLANIDGSATVGRGQNAFFTFSGTDAPGDLASGLRYDIDWGDGATTVLANSNTIDPSNVLENQYIVSHVYGVVGAKTITLKVTDDEGLSNTTTLDIVISAVFIDEATGTLIIGGTNNADRITLTNTIGGVQARINNQLYPPLAPENGLIQVFGGGGNDTISLSSNVPFPVEAFGGAGNDYITGGAFADVLHGEDGNDRLLGGNGSDLLFGGSGLDTLSGGNGNDFLYGDSDAQGDLANTGFDDFLINLTPSDVPGADKLSGDNGDDTLDGGAGKDRLNGGTGNDMLFGGDDADYLSGDNGDDLLLGEDGSDSLYGQAGNDVLIGGLLSDTIYGSSGSDLLLGDDLDQATAIDLFAAWVATGTSDLDTMRSFTSGATEDDVADVFNGQLGDDWFVAFLNDRVRDGSQFQGDHVDRDGMPVY